MSAWQEYKKKLGTTRPWDVLTEEPVSVETSSKRMSICEECPELIPVTKPGIIEDEIVNDPEDTTAEPLL